MPRHSQTFVLDVAPQRLQQSMRRHLPYTHGGILRRRRQVRSAGREGEAEDGFAMTDGDAFVDGFVSGIGGGGGAVEGGAEGGGASEGFVGGGGGGVWTVVGEGAVGFGCGGRQFDSSHGSWHCFV